MPTVCPVVAATAQKVQWHGKEFCLSIRPAALSAAVANHKLACFVLISGPSTRAAAPAGLANSFFAKKHEPLSMSERPKECETPSLVAAP